MERIVVGTDLGPRSQRAVEEAAALAKMTGATLHLVCACQAPTVPMGEAVMVVPDHNAYIESTQADLDAMAETLRKRHGIEVETHAPSGTSSDALCGVAETVKAEMIVVGNKRAQGSGRVLGSVAKRVISHAGCHVLVAYTG